MAYQYVKLVRMVRSRLIKAFQDIDAWRVEADQKIIRVSDGLWVQYVHHKHGGHYAIGNTDHGVPQMMIDGDDDLASGFHAILNFHPTVNRKRTVLTNLGIDV